MSMKMSLKDFLGVDSMPALSADSIAFKAALDFESEVFRKLKEKGLSQKDLAELLDVSPAAVSKMLSKGTNLTIKTMAKVACALDCALSAIELKDANSVDYSTVCDSETISATCTLNSNNAMKSESPYTFRCQ